MIWKQTTISNLWRTRYIGIILPILFVSNGSSWVSLDTKEITIQTEIENNSYELYQVSSQN